MQTQTHDEMIAVIKAAKRGETIEYCRLDGPERWGTAEPVWNFTLYTYRVKPKPLEVWLNKYPEGYNQYAYFSERDADAAATPGRTSSVLFRAVTTGDE